MEAIGTQLGVSARTISEDLRRFEVTSKREPKVDSLGRKNQGGPKGSRKPPNVQAKHDKIVTLSDAGI